jgi:hypothetical protein
MESAVRGPLRVRRLLLAHAPENAEKRRRMASRAGKGRASKVTKDLHQLLEDLTAHVVDGKLETSKGRWRTS